MANGSPDFVGRARNRYNAFKKGETRWQKWRERGAVETDLTSIQRVAEQIDHFGKRSLDKSDAHLRSAAATLRQQALEGIDLDYLLPEAFAITRELAHRVIGIRPFDAQVMASVAIHRGKLVEMQTGEGKTLAAVLAAALHAFTGRGVHILTFNDYLARRDAAWMGPIYEALGLRVGVLQEGMDADVRRAVYAADVTYAAAKEVGFDFLRSCLARHLQDVVQRPFHFAIIDEADSILIDEARVPLVIAGAGENSETDPHRIAAIVDILEEGIDWERDKHARNVQLTTCGSQNVEAQLVCGNLHANGNALLLAAVNQALHARALLRRNVDYIVRDGRIALIDELTGRVVPDRRWPNGLQAALEAKEDLVVQSGGQILGSITLQHLFVQYPMLAGMTATAQSAADELTDLYRLRVVPIPPNRPCVREDLPDLIFSHREAKERALVHEIMQMHEKGRPVLVGTGSVDESEHLVSTLAKENITCRILNAKNDEAEAEIIAEAGAVGAVTISTNMAGRGTDIRLGGAREEGRARVVALGGLYVIGSNRHESRRIDDQLRGRAGRQGDPGTSRFFVSLKDPLLVRFGIDNLIPPKLRPAQQEAPLDNPIIRREVERLQRIVEGQNQEISATLARYSDFVEKQRSTMFAWRLAVLAGEAESNIATIPISEGYSELLDRVGAEELKEAERVVTLHHIDAAWADHLAFVAEVREGIHLAGIGGMDPLQEFHKQVAPAFGALHKKIKDRTVETLMALRISDKGIMDTTLRAPSSTWTYLINDRAVTELHHMLHGPGSSGFSAAGVLMTWPLLLGWAFWRRLSRHNV